ncbi:MAG TPA: VWA domain-containing protein [Bryobacteraceae bacterium]|nr:VWA domain-containing protein [Bryobacteraceae bacterium]
MRCHASANQIGLFIALSLSALASAQDDVVFRSGVSLVRVDAEAVDATGAVVAGLKKEDFRILDENKEQQIVNFSFAEEPLDLILLFDTAGSMHGKILELMRATQLGFNELRKGDRVSVWVFGSTPTELLPFSDNLEQVDQAIVLKALTLRPNGSSKLEPAADEAAMRFNREPKTRRKRAVLVVTDKSGSRGPNQTSIVRDLWNADAVLSELIMERPGPPPRMLDRNIDDLVDKTGGAAIVAGNPGEAFRESVHYLRSGYAMYYALPDAPDATPRGLQVELTAEAAARYPNVRVRARSGYLTSRQQSSSAPRGAK